MKLLYNNLYGIAAGTEDVNTCTMCDCIYVTARRCLGGCYTCHLYACCIVYVGSELGIIGYRADAGRHCNAYYTFWLQQV